MAFKGDDGSRSMKEIVQTRFINDVISVADAWKVLVMDDVATKVISSALTMYDIMERRVTIVENLFKNRQPFPEMDVIYFVTPTDESVNAIIADFPSTKACKYGSVHIIFTSTMPSSVMKLLQTCPLLVSKIKTLKEIYLEFIAAEGSIFHFDQPNSLAKLYGEGADSSHPLSLANKLTTLCITLNEIPYIRYQGSSMHCREAARLLLANLQNYKRMNPSFVSNGDDRTERERGNLLLLDRTFDPATPIMHDYHYQAMAYDLLPVKEGGFVSYEKDTGKGKVAAEASLSEADEFWIEYRHLHVSKVSSVINDKLREFMQINATAANQPKKGEDVSLASLGSVVKEMPEYQQFTNKQGFHSTVVGKCLSEFTKQSIMDVSDVEQTITTGVDDSGAEVKGSKLVEKVLEICSNAAVSKDNKIRLLAIFYMGIKSATAEDKRKLIQAANLTGPEQQILANTERLLRDMLSSSAVAKGSMFSSIFKKTQKTATGSNSDIIDSRHIPLLKTLLEQSVAGELPTDRFPAMGATAPVSGTAATAAKSVRKFNANSRWGKKEQSNFTGGRYLVFIAGGVSHVEMKVAYDCMNQLSKEVILGGTQIVTPKDLMKDISSLHVSQASTGGSKTLPRPSLL